MFYSQKKKSHINSNAMINSLNSNLCLYNFTKVHTYCSIQERLKCVIIMFILAAFFVNFLHCYTKSIYAYKYHIKDE